MTFDLVSPLPLRECVRLLRAATDSRWAVFGDKPVLGYVGDKSIRLRKRTYYRNSSQSWLSGTLVEENGHTRLHCAVGMHPFIRVFLEYWIAAVLLGGGAILIRIVRMLLRDHGSLPPYIWLGIILPPLLMGLGVILLVSGEYISNDDEGVLVDFIKQTLLAHDG